MADFGAAGQYLTPDGRAVSLPSQIAALFPTLSPAGAGQSIGTSPASTTPELPAPGPGPAPAGSAPVALPSGGAPAFGPADAAALAAQIPPPDATAAPVTSPAQAAEPGPAAQPARGPVTEPGPDQGTQPVAPEPPPRLRTQADVERAQGAAFAGGEQALAKEQAAVQRSAQIEADTATQQGQALAARDAETHRILQERARVAAANQAELERRVRERDQLAAQIASTRIDRSVDHPVWAAISAAMVGLGQTLNRQPVVDAMGPVFAAVDRKVAGQMADLDNKRKVLADMGVGIAEQRQMGADRLAEIDVRRDAALQQAKQAVETIATQMHNPAALAGAQKVSAEIDGKRAALLQNFAKTAQDRISAEATRAQTLQMHRESLGMQYTIHKETIAAQEREKMAEVAERALAAGDKATAERAKAVQERAVGDPRTGFALLNPAGQAKMVQADRAEAQARQQQDPTAAQKLRDYAQQLRTSAQLNDAALAPTAEAQKELTKQVGSAQDITDRISDAIAKLQAGPGVLNREAWSSITTDLGNIAGKYQQAMGERVSTKAFEQTLQHILNFDPDSLFQRAASKDKAIESLKTLKSMVATDADAALKANRMQTGWKPIAKAEDAARFDTSQQTAAEIGEDQKPTVLQRVGGRMLNPLHGYEGFGFEQQAQQAANEEPGRINGLPPTTVAALRGVAARADRAGDAERAKIVESIAAPIAAGLQEGGRSSLAAGMLETLRVDNPRLYGEIVGALPAEQADMARKLGEMRAGLPGSQLPPLPKEPSGFDPDAAAKATEDAADRARHVQKALDEKFGKLEPR